ncbi:Stk1 family PASTA domain-containing Ser/Thr kinase [Streptomyces radicis]|uniref:non-specific serine/threonine protein kinase n=1 Tax=Streptomyces radicis TaxID=1750517 RepID=A0A3A9WUA7_9ACTN|nr:Stk1 family PASTA domain-containing Ser/Thr kinase [Streptomyces radicis]RKN11376.1 serine/threonine protein kinase [Streptomyces radicis]RKN26604.1 serine/threonine protein kinase [Streptomyces radicis]
MSDHARPPGDHSGRSVGGGRYVLQDLLGTGGMASVHLAYDTVLERHVAIKTMHSELGREDAFRDRFKREAQSVAKLSHTNIVSVFDTGEDRIGDGPVPYIVMEYVEGRPLRDELERDIAQFGAMPADKALTITADVLAALDISHEMGLVHRDIKPGNVMLNRRNVVKVMDFGIARAMQSGVTAMTQTGMVVGTPQYLSPEQALGRGVDARSDLYSVGVMLFELLTGRLPFDADSPLAIAYAHVQEEPPAPSSINAAVPPAVDALVATALKKNPNERFPSAETFRAECLRVAGSLTGTAPRIVPGAQTPTNSGAAVSHAVFPEFGGPTPPGAAPGTAPGAPIASPYAPTPPAGGYGYPQSGAPSTPPPFGPGHATVTSNGGGQGGGEGRSAWMVVTAAVVAIALVAAVAIVVVLSQGGDDGGAEAGESTGGTVGTEDPEGGSGGDAPTDAPTRRHVDGDPEQVINPDMCVNAPQHWNQDEYPGAISMPDFYDVHIDSVKACIQAAGWYYDEQVQYKDEVIKGEGMVVEQSPPSNEPYNPDDEEQEDIVLTVSTGDEPLAD